MNFPERLTMLQQGKGVTKQNIDATIGLSRVAYYRYEKGEREPTASILIALADYFDVSLDYLVGRTDNPTFHKP